MLRKAFENVLPQQIFTAPERRVEIPLNKWLLTLKKIHAHAVLVPKIFIT